MPTIPKTASPAATILIIGEEALELVAYLDSTDIVTIGVGHVILPKFDAALFNLTPQRLQELITDAQKRRVMPAATKNLLRITRDQALALLAKDIAQVVLFINAEHMNGRCLKRLFSNQFPVACNKKNRKTFHLI